MAVQPDAPDGVSRLAELMRDAPHAAARPAPIDPGKRRRRRRRGWIIASLVVVALVAGAGGYLGYALSAPLAAPTVATELPEIASPAAAALALPPEGESALSISGADAYLGADASGIWPAASVGGDAAVPMASISKLVTTLVVLDAKPLASPDDPGPTLTFDKADNALYDKYYVLGATIAPMPIGSRMSQHDALETMLVVSACNYAEAVTDWAFGSQSAFLAATRQWLAANGLSHTRLVEPTGIDSRNTSTPSDLIALGKLAMANPTVAQIVGMPELSVPGLTGSNTNSLLGVDGVRGIKTGTLQDFSNLLYSAQLPVNGLDAPLEVTGVLLGGFSRDTVNREVSALLDSIVAGFHAVPVGAAGDEVGSYSTRWGASARVVLASGGSIVTWSDTPIVGTLRMTGSTTGAKGEQVGSVTWTAGPQTVTVPVVLDATIEQPDAWWRLTHPGELGG